MKKLSLIGLVVLFAAALSCKKERIKSPEYNTLKNGVACVDEPDITSINLHPTAPPMQTGNIVGQISVWNDNDHVYVKIDANSNFTGSKVYIGPCPSPANLDDDDNHVDHDPATNTYTYQFDNTFTAGEAICVKVRVTGTGAARQASGQHTIQLICEDCEIELGDFRTQSKGGWGAPPTDENSAQYMYDHWDVIGSVTIGCNSTTLTFNSPQEITAYLPNGMNSPSPFNTDLATQITALSISLALDAGVDDFGASDESLACLIVDTDEDVLSLFNGMSVSEILALANDVLGGCSAAFSADEMNAIVRAINMNFHGGDTNNGLLTCGGC